MGDVDEGSTRDDGSAAHAIENAEANVQKVAKLRKHTIQMKTNSFNRSIIHFVIEKIIQTAQ